MPIKKIFKIAGLVVLAFFVLYFGLMIALGGVGQITGNTVSRWSDAGMMGSFQVSLPSSEEGDMMYAPAMDMARSVKNESSTGATAAIDKKIIKTGSLSLKVEKAETAAESITNIAKLNKGEIANSYFSESGRGVKSGYLTVRVPFSNFDNAFNEIKKVATQVTAESSNAQDITADYID